MTIWKDENNGLHDDMDGTALTLPSWPQGLTSITDEEAASISAVNNAPTPEQVAKQTRDQRNSLLSSADIQINILEDAGKDVSAWRTYRQALRDVPAQKGFPSKVKWPTVPTAS